MDITDLEAEIAVATEEALTLADELTVEIGRSGGTVSNRVLQLSRDYNEKRRYIRRLRLGAVFLDFRSRR